MELKTETRYLAPCVKVIETTMRSVLCQSVPAGNDGMFLEEGEEL